MLPDAKLSAIRAAIARVARVAGPAIQIRPMSQVTSREAVTILRFVALWQARNRRTRVAMFRNHHA
jgi:hypothetical protein